MTSDFHVNMNEYLPLRDVVFNTLRQAILRGGAETGRKADGNCSFEPSGGEQNSDS